MSYILPPDNIFIVTKETYIDKIATVLPEINKDNYIFEPSSKGTVSAIALSSIIIERRHPGASMIIYSSSVVINSLDPFKMDIESGLRVVDHSHCLVIFGVNPTRVDSSYGYIKIGDMIYNENDKQAYEVKSFIKSPNYKESVRFFEDSGFLWNTGIFICKVQVFLEELSKLMPDLYSAMLEIDNYYRKLSESKVKAEVYHGLDNISIEDSILKKSKNILCIKASFDWDTIDSWTSLSRLLASDDKDNIHSGKVISIDTDNTIILGDKHTLIAAIGIKDIIVAKVGDALLLCHKSSDHRLKELIAMIKEDGTLDYFL
jgi:mannose-1-phosphate guanylyltransferase